MNGFTVVSDHWPEVKNPVRGRKSAVSAAQALHSVKLDIEINSRARVSMSTQNRLSANELNIAQPLFVCVRRN